MKTNKIKTVLIALDYDPTSQKIAEEGFSLAKAMSAEGILLHVIADSTYYSALEYSPIVGFLGFSNNDWSHLLDADGLKNGPMQGIENEKAILTKRIDYQKKINEKYYLVNQLFESKDASVYRSGNDVIIRMQGFGFDVGKSNIKPEYFGLLTKIQNAIKISPDSKVIVEGFTDSFGSDESNLKLSQERSDAVTSYLKANMKSLNNENMSSIGYGENNPIANNETKEGRSKNRRIDIIIKNDLELLSMLQN